MGRAIKLGDESYTVIGVMPPFFEYPHHAGLWLPLALDPYAAPPADQRHNIYTVARLKRVATPKIVRADLDAIAARLALENPGTDTDWSLTTVPVRDDLVEDLQPRLLAYLLGASGVVLLIAGINVSSMFVAGALERGPDTAIRLALGAGPRLMVQQLLTQGLVLAALGGGFGLLLALCPSDPSWR